MEQLLQLEAQIPGLYATAPAALPFAPSLHARAFVLRRERGDLLVYSAPGAGDLGVSRQYVNHRHEAMFASADVGAPVFCHVDERESIARSVDVRATFSKRHMLEDDFEVIPTPGHTSGATAFLWDSGEHRMLFTGDTISLAGGEWVAAVLDSSDRRAHLESLELIRELDFDVLVPWIASAAEPPLAATSREGARRHIDGIHERVGRGEDR